MHLHHCDYYGFGLTALLYEERHFVYNIHSCKQKHLLTSYTVFMIGWRNCASRSAEYRGIQRTCGAEETKEAETDGISGTI